MYTRVPLRIVARPLPARIGCRSAAGSCDCGADVFDFSVERIAQRRRMRPVHVVWVAPLGTRQISHVESR